MYLTYLNFLWILAPIFLIFVIPISIFLFIILSSFFISLMTTLTCKSSAGENEQIHWSIYFINFVWKIHGKLLHGYEVVGINNIPHSGPAIIIYYHSAFPLDYYFFVIEVIRLKNRLIHSIIDRFLHSLTFINGMTSGYKCSVGSVQSITNDLLNDNLVGIAPGGLYEALKSNHYNLCWKNRLGFAKVAIEASLQKGQTIPVIPMFTQNCRESYRYVAQSKDCLMGLYSRIKIPASLLHGGYPVKLRGIIGKPVSYNPFEDSPQILKEKIKHELESMIDKYQRKPGSIISSIFVDRCKKVNVNDEPELSI